MISIFKIAAGGCLMMSWLIVPAIVKWIAL
jgi:hypothetical protein